VAGLACLVRGVVWALVRLLAGAGGGAATFAGVGADAMMVDKDARPP
jgi:hypothetical protein